MGDKRKRDEAAVDENDGAVVDLGKSSKKIKSGDKEKVKKERKTKKDKKEKKEKKKLEKELKKKAREEANGAAGEGKMEVDGEPNGVQKAEKSKKVKREEKYKRAKQERMEKRAKLAEEEKAEQDEEKKEKKEKKKEKTEKKLKPEEKEEEQEENGVNGAKAEEEQSAPAAPADTETPAENGTEEAAEGAVGDAEMEEARKSQRFIVFISNLPYTATQESVTKHFEKLQPTSVRVPLERGGKKGRGFAFVEFAGFDRMKTCLKQYHGTMFEDGDKPARKIKVELTAGGGGSKSEARKMKILEKNQKLKEERARDAQEAKRAKTASATTNGAGTSAADDQSHIHPSRRARVPV
ncbi:hypothetical protein H112_07089 [Trichophyton rubrum D6]|nr:uncharacterized protein TERG_02425 [Trichophyton rubrum CBS 118892]EZF11872.1 hypothetical protein H100_07111 [Trichophyton rubrum MR850]EZF38767.1 hypothetical protein H102_07075 [Trichophyton rubrum CBS 100081]EZF49400.1 hypothetical protein H103_07096 [Trichophyton rubrum CBS 288.86]EZF60012.1 hypothetical protein H104_07052 [Trichophyton rubrum CBS 289.86]EZF70667.1 hypothetical protein H105_07109 [Trichophyton soudanense CBS 452.61]EZF81329.1 hypothetical protein H110_07092 [Trichophy